MSDNNKQQENDREVKPLMVSIDIISKQYLPGISKKRIRKLCNTYLRTVKVGNRIFVDRKMLEDMLTDPDREHIL